MKRSSSDVVAISKQDSVRIQSKNFLYFPRTTNESFVFFSSPSEILVRHQPVRIYFVFLILNSTMISSYCSFSSPTNDHVHRKTTNANSIVFHQRSISRSLVLVLEIVHFHNTTRDIDFSTK